jgi:DNA-binding transcriptional MerR regulator
MTSEPVEAPLASISTVERDTGLSKDTLRVWERRYGFPQPSRDSNGERAYPADQLEKLRVIRRLMDRGLRPGEVVAAPLSELHARVQSLPVSAAPHASVSTEANTALHLLKAHRVDELRVHLAHELMRRGLQRFVLETVAPLNELVGNGWLEGSIEIFEEHLYSDQIQHLLRQAIGAITLSEQTPRILLTTLPGEQHQLGLLMAQACLTAEGAHCISLGVQTPSWDIVQAVRAHHADIVGLSFSQAIPLNVARADVAALRKHLNRRTEIWAGGSLWARVRKTTPGVTTIASLTAIPAALQTWREQHSGY